MINLESIKRKYFNQELYMLAMLDCFGVPHTPDNIHLKSYVDIVANELSKNKIEVNYVNMHSIGCNKTWHLKDIIDKDYTKKEYYDINLTQSIKATLREDIFPFPLNPNFLSTYYSNPSNPNMKITSHYADSKNPIIFYSCGQMNMHHYLKMRSNDIKQILPEILFHLHENLYKTLSDVEQMINHLISINKTVDIYMFGVYPMFESPIVRKVLAPFYASINKKVKDYFSEYNNIHFIDVLNNINYVAENDCHPNYKGQCNMANKALKLLSEEDKYDN